LIERHKKIEERKEDKKIHKANTYSDPKMRRKKRKYKNWKKCTVCGEAVDCH